MFAEFRTALRPASTLLLFFTLMTGIAYPLLMTGMAQTLMPRSADGNLIRDNGRVVGSALIGQSFVSESYFHGRPSAAGKTGYDASASSGSNLAPGSTALRDRIASDVAALRKEGVNGPIPTDLVTTSASGLDPDISVDAALVQIPRVAAARNISPSVLRDLVMRREERPLLGIIGEPRVNVLLLNRQLDQLERKRSM